MNTYFNISASDELALSRKDMFEKSSVAIHEIDTDGVIRSVNEAECQLLGYPRTELIGRHIWEFVAAEYRETVREAVMAKMARQGPLAPVTREYRRGDGTYMWLNIRETLIENSAGEVIGIRSGLFDITESRRVAAEIQKQHDRMRFLLRSLTKAIVTADPLGHVDFMNPAAENLTGWLQQEACGRPLEAICPVQSAPGEPVDLMSCVLASPTISSSNGLMINRSTVEYRVNWSATPIRNDDGVIVGAALVLEQC